MSDKGTKPHFPHVRQQNTATLNTDQSSSATTAGKQLRGSEKRYLTPWRPFGGVIRKRRRSTSTAVMGSVQGGGAVPCAPTAVPTALPALPEIMHARS